MLEAFAQTRFDVVTFTERLAEAMDDGALQRCRQICRWLRRLGIVPHGQLFGARRTQQPLEIILARATLKINQLGHAESSQGRSAFGGNRSQQWKYLLKIS